MADRTQTPASSAIPKSLAWCNSCGDFSSSCRLVGVIEQSSRGGGGRFACAPCRAKHHLVPVEDRP